MTASSSNAVRAYVRARLRSPTVGFLLAVPIGPLAALYAGRPGLTFAILGTAFSMATLGWGLLLMWPWSLIAVPMLVHRHNREVRTEAMLRAARDAAS